MAISLVGATGMMVAGLLATPEPPAQVPFVLRDRGRASLMATPLENSDPMMRYSVLRLLEEPNEAESRPNP